MKNILQLLISAKVYQIRRKISFNKVFNPPNPQEPKKLYLKKITRTKKLNHQSRRSTTKIKMWSRKSLKKWDKIWSSKQTKTVFHLKKNKRSWPVRWNKKLKLCQRKRKQQPSHLNQKCLKVDWKKYKSKCLSEKRNMNKSQKLLCCLITHSQ